MYDKKLQPVCLYCLYSGASINELHCICSKRGVVTYDFHCRKYEYDPLKRTPKRMPRQGMELFPNDFSID